MTQTDLAALISSRICHDLISPIGAISNGVELLLGFGETASPELGLIGDSATVATGKLRFFRVAFGAAKAGSEIGTAELAELCGALSGGRFQATLDIAPTPVPRVAGKCLLLALLCAEKSMPLGGEATVSSGGADGQDLIIHATGSRIRPDAELWALASGRADLAGLDGAHQSRAVEPSEVQFAILGQSLSAVGKTLTHDFDASPCVITLHGILATTLSE